LHEGLVVIVDITDFGAQCSEMYRFRVQALEERAKLVGNILVIDSIVG
jgi:hypothetical protein